MAKCKALMGSAVKGLKLPVAVLQIFPIGLYAALCLRCEEVCLSVSPWYCKARTLVSSTDTDDTFLVFFSVRRCSMFYVVISPKCF